MTSGNFSSTHILKFCIKRIDSRNVTSSLFATIHKTARKNQHKRMFDCAGDTEEQLSSQASPPIVQINSAI